MKFWLSMIKSRFLKEIFNEYNLYFRNINLYSFTASITRWTTTRSISIIARYINRRRNNVKDSHVGHGMIRINYYTTVIYIFRPKKGKRKWKKGYQISFPPSLHLDFDFVCVISFNFFDICYIENKLKNKINRIKINYFLF